MSSEMKLFGTPLLLLLVRSALAATVKRGIAWADPEHPEDVALFRNLIITWNYNWAQSPNSYLTGVGKFVPMQWNGNGINNLEQAVRSQNATVVLVSRSSHSFHRLII